VISRRSPVAASAIQKFRRALGTSRGASTAASLCGKGRGRGSTQASSVVGAGVPIGLLERVEVGKGEREAVAVGSAVGGGVDVGGGEGDAVGLAGGVSVAVGEGVAVALQAVSNASARTSQARLHITAELLPSAPRRVDAYGEPFRSSPRGATVRRCRRGDRQPPGPR